MNEGFHQSPEGELLVTDVVLVFKCLSFECNMVVN
jgi:hypothetical protein